MQSKLSFRPQSIILNTIVEETDLNILSEKYNMSAVQIQEKFNRYLVTYIQGYLYNLLFPERFNVNFFFPDYLVSKVSKTTPAQTVRQQIKQPTLIELVRKLVVESNTTHTEITALPPVTRVVRKGVSNRISQGVLYNKLKIYMESISGDLFNKLLLASIDKSYGLKLADETRKNGHFAVSSANSQFTPSHF